ncbi:MAG: ATP-dependent helicase [Pseudanabaenaceae cyanobacterium bins.39]|nr:ATP-dependent helicase [Pseudanabaenaceae cyanobacterium bins.39]
MIPSEVLAQLRNQLRVGQQAMADWQGGELAVSAVPGAGKSTGMAVAAVIAISRFQLHRQKQLVIVTLTRSAVSNIRQKILSNLKTLRLSPSAFSVSTLHSFAYAIANNHRHLSGIGEATIVSDAHKTRLIKSAANLWIRENPQLYKLLLEERNFDGDDTERLRRQTVLKTDILPRLGQQAIATAKSAGLKPRDLRQAVAPNGEQILEIAAGIYEIYERLLQQEQAIDYEDMILSALRILEDDRVRQYWQERIFAVFEDEAQDSSPLQARLIEILAQAPDHSAKNLIRVGDPNQAINSTFTTADPVFFTEFCDRCRRNAHMSTLSEAGRSTAKIMQAANFVISWVNSSEYGKFAKPFYPQDIKPVPKDDPQANANPEPIGQGVEIYINLESIEQEVALIASKIVQIVQQEPQTSMAILVRQHKQGKFVAEQINAQIGELLKEQQIKFYDVEQNDRRSQVPMDMLAILQFLERPHSPDNLKAALEVLKFHQKISAQQDLNALASNPERFLYPTIIDPPLTGFALETQAKCVGLLRAKIELPLYNLIPFIAFTLYDDDQSSLLATADKLGDYLNQSLIGNYCMETVIATLKELVESASFIAIDDENPEERYTATKQITLINIHKAKGLDWDVVFMPFLHKKICPGEQFVMDSVKFLGDFDLADVVRTQIRAIIRDEHHRIPNAITAWQEHSHAKQAEEFRLLYVGMTRAKKLLCLSAAQSAPLSWNTIENRVDNAQVCPILPNLQRHLQNLSQS